MKKLWLLSFLCIYLTSCFELVEQINVDKDGSGDITVTLNMYESKDKLKAFTEAPDGVVGDYKAPDRAELDAFFSRVVATVSDVEGMSNVKSDIHYEDFIFSISGSFDNVATMNTAVNNFITGMSKGMLHLRNDYAFKEGRFIRSFTSPIKPEEYDNIPLMQRMILESARIISVYRFEEAIQEMTSADTELSFDKKEARFESTLGAIVKGDTSPDNVIRL